MGLLLSSTVAEIFLQEIDKLIINVIKKQDDKGMWISYVDYGLYIYQTIITKLQKKSTMNLTINIQVSIYRRKRNQQ